MTDSNAPGAGFEYPRFDVAWTKRDALLFANSIGATADELHFLYELHPSFAVFPTYPIILPFKHTDADVVDFYARSASTPIPGIPKLDSRRVVDGERKIEFYKPLPVTSEGKQFEIRSKVLGVYDKGKPGTVVETEQVLVDKSSGEKYCRAVGSGFFVGQGGWGGPKGPKVPSYNPPNTAPAATSLLKTTPQTALLYRLNGDYNPLHADPAPGSKMGFGGPIIHGLFSWNTAAHAVLQELGGSNPLNMKDFQARFASPVRPGDEVLTKMWVLEDEGKDKDGFSEVRFSMEIVGGKVCLSNGRARVKVVGRKSVKDCGSKL